MERDLLSAHARGHETKRSSGCGGVLALRSLLVITLLLGGSGLAVPCGRSVEREAAFIERVVPHQEVAIRLMDEAIPQATHPALRAVAVEARGIRAAQIAANRQLRPRLVGSGATPRPREVGVVLDRPRNFDRDWMRLTIARDSAWA